jgi:hypothetical protein
MNPLESLAPDQRAVVALVLQQGRSYDEIAALLGMPVDGVRARAHAGLASLARDNGLPGEVTGPLADYLLGQLATADAEATRGLLAESPPARAWASDVSARLQDVAPQGLPEIPEPAETAATPPVVPGPRPRPVREAAPEPARNDSPPAASRVGGALLIAGVVAVVAVVLFLVLRGGDDPGTEQAAATPTATPAASATPAATATPQAADTIALRSPAGGKAKGTMALFIQDKQLLFALEATDVPPSSAGSAYAVWVTAAGKKARRLGFTDPVGTDGRLAIQGPSDKDLAGFPKLYATYERVVVSKETREDAKRPGPVILAGKLPQGR